MFTSDDEKLIAKKGISVETVQQQVNRFKKGFDPIELNRAAIVGDGITQLSADEEERFRRLFEAYDGLVSKFVPASGAASRMFKELESFRNDYSGSEEAYQDLVSDQNDPVYLFFKNLDSFAFYEDLKDTFTEENEMSLEEAHLSRRYAEILTALLSEEGLNYSNLPKGLLKFHSYGKFARTAAGEQIVEGWGHASLKTLNLHFTVSPDHLEKFSQHIYELLPRLEFGENVHVSFSTQKLSTDIVAVDTSNVPFRKKSGELLFRPAGHGALLANLSELDSDIVFIKNIDNILPDHLKPLSIGWKKALAGILIEYQKKIFTLLQRNDEGEDITEEGLKLLHNLGIEGLAGTSKVIEYLDRPIRVCGMVRNEGEPGGGPFWINTEGRQSLQIVESAQIDTSANNQFEIAQSATHFNPVDIVCGLRNFKGHKFDLTKFCDPEQGFISTKSYEGKELKAMELPGLWNGGMANWNTIFVEVPVETFSPVKTVNDLLKKEHQPS